MSYATIAKVVIAAAVAGGVGYVSYVGYRSATERRSAERQERRIATLKRTLSFDRILIDFSTSVMGYPDVVNRNLWALDVITELFLRDNQKYRGMSLSELEALKEGVNRLMVLMGLKS